MSTVDLWVLGSTEVWHRGRQLVLRRRQQRRVLGILTLQANQPVGMDRLIHLLWGDDPPAQARAVVQTRVSEIRAIVNTLSGAPVRLDSRSTGYLLHADPETIDSVRFHALTRRAHATSDPAHAADPLREGLALWRGRVLEAEPGSPLWSAFGLALESARLTAVEDLITVTLHSGDPGTVADQAVSEASANPARERLVALSLRALHAAGRTPQALQHYDSWRRWLRAELGADPSPELAALHVALLRSDAGLPDDPADRWQTRPTVIGASGPPAQPEDADRISAPPASTLPADIRDFTGRTAEVDLIRGLLVDRARTGTLVVAVCGPGGVGKTALALHVAHGLREAYPDGQLYANLRGIEEDEPAATGDILVRLLRALGVDNAAIPTDPDERADLYHGLLVSRRVLLVLDNAACDDQVGPLIPGAPGCSVVITSRRRIGAALGAAILPLEVLPPPQATELLAVVARGDRVAAEPQAAAQLCAQCGHLPLAIRVAGAKLAAKPHWSIDKLVRLLADERRRLDRFSHGQLDVRASIALSYRELSGPAAALLRRLADLDLPEYPVWLAAAAMDTDLPAAEELCEQLFDAQLLDISGTEQNGQPRFRMHDLVRLFAREQASATGSAEFADSSRRVAGALLDLCRTAVRPLHGGYTMVDVASAAEWPLDARAAQGIVADPMCWFERDAGLIAATVRRSAREPGTGLCWTLVAALSTFYETSRCYDEWHDACDLALATASTAGDASGAARINFARSVLAGDISDFARAERYADTALQTAERIGDEFMAVICLVQMGNNRRLGGDIGAARAPGEAGLRRAERLGNPDTLILAVRRLAHIELASGHLEQAKQHLDRALELTTLTDSRISAATVQLSRARLLLALQRPVEAEQASRAALDVATQLGDRAGRGACLHVSAMCALALNRSERARDMLLEARQVMQTSHPTVLQQEAERLLAQL